MTDFEAFLEGEVLYDVYRETRVQLLFESDEQYGIAFLDWEDDAGTRMSREQIEANIESGEWREL